MTRASLVVALVSALGAVVAWRCRPALEAQADASTITAKADEAIVPGMGG